jgi:hypothetical protein
MDTQSTALERTIRAGAAVLTDKHSALLALCRELARHVDVAGPDGPSTGLTTGPPPRQGKLAHLRSRQGSVTSTGARTRNNGKTAGA